MNIKTQALEVPKWALSLLNNVYEIEKKLHKHGDPASLMRNVDRIKDILSAEKLFYEDPMHQPFNETRTDLDVSISGEGTEDLVVVEVIKPIIRIGGHEYSSIVQKGIVVVESRK